MPTKIILVRHGVSQWNDDSENDRMGPDYLNASRTAYTVTARTIERTSAREIVNAIN
jgi:broad specificity phosphatase PhoE